MVHGSGVGVGVEQQQQQQQQWVNDDECRRAAVVVVVVVAVVDGDIFVVMYAAGVVHPDHSDMYEDQEGDYYTQEELDKHYGQQQQHYAGQQQQHFARGAHQGYDVRQNARNQQRGGAVLFDDGFRYRRKPTDRATY